MSRRRPGRPGPSHRRQSRGDPTGSSLEAGHAGALADRHATLTHDACEAAAQLRRVEQDVAAGWPIQAGVPQRGVDLVAGRVTVQELEVLPVFGGLVDPGPELVDLVGLVGQGERAGLLEVAVDAVLAGERDQLLEVLDPLLLQPRQLVGEVADPVGEAVGEAGLAEAAVATAGPEPNGLRLQHRHPEGRVRVGQGDGRPQAGETRADDRHVDLEALSGVQWRIGGRARVAQPVAAPGGGVGPMHEQEV